MNGPEFFTQMFAAWNRHDVEALVGMLDENGTYIDIGLGVSNTGHEAVRKYLAQLETRFSTDYTMTQSGIALMTEHAYVVEWVMKGTQNGTGYDLPPTGRRFEIHGVSVGEMRDGKVVRNTDYWNRLGLLKQLGLVPKDLGLSAAVGTAAD